MPDHIVVYKDTAGEFRWKRISANGEPLSSSTEGYEHKGHAIEQAYSLNTDVDDVRVQDTEVSEADA